MKHLKTNAVVKKSRRKIPFYITMTLIYKIGLYKDFLIFKQYIIKTN